MSIQNISSDAYDWQLKKIQIGELEGAFMSAGDGPVVIMVHCSSASHKQWIELGKQYSERAHVIVPDLLGYGSSSAWPKGEGLSMEYDLEFLQALIKMADREVHLIGHSYGGMLCMEAAAMEFASGDHKIKSMFLIEPVLFKLLRDIQHQDWPEIYSVASNTIELVKSDDYHEAANVYMGYWLGDQNWQNSAERFKQAVYDTLHKVADEFTGILGPGYSPEHYSRLSCPVTLMVGSNTTKAANSLINVLSGLLPEAETVTVAGAGHMSPMTHTQAVYNNVGEHLERYL